MFLPSLLNSHCVLGDCHITLTGGVLIIFQILRSTDGSVATVHYQIYTIYKLLSHHIHHRKLEMIEQLHRSKLIFAVMSIN